MKPTVTLVVIGLSVAFYMVLGFREKPSSLVQSLSNESTSMPESRPFQNEPEEIWTRYLSSSGRRSDTGKVRAIKKGKAEISSDNGQIWKSVAVGTSFTVNDILRTDSQAVLDFCLQETGPVLRLSSGSWIRFVRMETENTGVERISIQMLDLEQGHLLAGLPKLSASSVFLIRTPTAIIEPLGRFEIEADGSIIGDSGRLYSDGEIYKIPKEQKFLF